MKNEILLCAINAKYIHSNLAVRYLKKYCETQIEGIDIAEFSINDNISSILKKLCCSDARIYGFSCYIWNISMVLDICSSLKKAKPEAVIILGGPEVSYDAANLLSIYSFINYIVIGEGEAAMIDLLRFLTAGKGNLPDIPGIAYRSGESIAITEPRPDIPDLDALPFPYDSFDGLDNKIIYYETSRGCPFNCQYCLSSTIRGVRYLSMDRVRQDIKSFAAAGIKQVKLVDRTFNCDLDRSMEIMQYIIDINPSANFHFEIAADLIDERFLEIVEKAPDGMFQFEIGVQSTNPKTLSEIKRKMDFDKVSHNVARLLSFKNAHIHLDLIAGLPYEDMESFEKSFNDVYSLKPDMLQLGFLKLLKGSGIRKGCEGYRIQHHDFPPYEVISTAWLSFKELMELKDIENVLEQYYNSGRFRHTLDFLFQAAETEPFDFYRRLSGYWNQKGHFNSPKNVNELYTILKCFVEDAFVNRLDKEQFSLMNEYMKLDWLLYVRSGSMPAAINRFSHAIIKEEIHGYIKNKLTDIDTFKDFKNLSLREILKQVGYEVFLRNIFADTPSRDEIVMFFPLRPSSSKKRINFTAVPLKEIILH
ncbi:MAG: B12-binding domain-containing radical SAM protein [Clostridia bacterium]|jgi:radical SAM superfamily enzyme YgiQ (UPF0313 family)|nr:B12-binding domain-containing radical SAM protein [Clostridia bacterium]